MRFVSQYTNFVINVRNPRKKYTEYGVDVQEEGIMAEFDANSWDQRDMEVALGAFDFHGLFQFEDEATPVPPAYRVSVYDTDEQASANEWDEETKAFVEQKLLSARSLGRDFVLVQEVALEAPWPSYDSFEGDPEALVVLALDLGFSLEDCIAYESSKWGQRRPDVLEALQTGIEARDSGEIIVT